MNYKKHPRRLRKWWYKGAANRLQFDEVSDDEVGDNEDLRDESFVRSVETSSCILANEFRVFVGTWNVAGRSPVGSLAVDLDDWLNLKGAADIYVLGFQEIVPLKARTVIGSEDETAALKWNSLIGKTLNNKFGCPWLTPTVHPSASIDNHCVQIPDSEGNIASTNGLTKYKLMASKKMVGVFISVWMKEELLKKYCVSNVKVCSVACGIMGYLGNKGSVSASMSIDGTSFCFIAAHLASGEKKGDEIRRNYQVSEIFRRTSFPRLPEDDDIPQPLTILGHDRIFWFGDLNYRLFLEDILARKFIKKKDWRALQEFDQLRSEQEYGGVFQGWREGNIEFAPTYKYSTSNCDRYSGGHPGKSGEKQRTPAWCDRILWYGKGMEQLSYYRSESKFSDHRPVSALFSTQIEFVKSTSPKVATLLGKVKCGENESKATLFSLMVQDIETSPSQDQGRAQTTITSLASSIV
ncbi:hypothetical protein GIB67_035715 [Kingdonia uniflora]|uniref:Inositol polyphosphate-related phosphatase domain-containing protein n=1 Tax=Kingdonia uniflora TaxID=39325 RepID=A0A7J7M5F9_9MAGN|nr:hypothetical protein GIB67_035715 [Kingdonia uniflora]